MRIGPATIDLNGHRIIGVGGKDNTSIGIFANNQSNITVLNGTIQGFSIGVNVLDSVAKNTESYSQTNNRIVNMTLRDCLTNGFILGGQDARSTIPAFSISALTGSSSRAPLADSSSVRTPPSGTVTYR